MASGTRAQGMTQSVGCLPRMHKDLSLIPDTANNHVWQSMSVTHETLSPKLKMAATKENTTMGIQINLKNDGIYRK